MSPLTLRYVIQRLTEFVQRSGSAIDLILVGGLALQAYGFAERVTMDVDGELLGDLDALAAFLREHQVPSDLGENMSGWSVIAMPPGYRERAFVFHQDFNLCIRLLDPVDFIIAKLRRGTEQDLEDAENIARRFRISRSDVNVAAESALAASPKDTALFVFRKTVEAFCARIASQE